MGKRLPKMWETGVQSLGREDLLEKGMATHSSILPPPEKKGLKEKGFPGSSNDKASAYSAGDQGSIPGSRRSPREGNGNPL